MGRGKKLRKGIESLRRQVLLHQEKIVKELQNPTPDQGLIAKWNRDIEGFKGEIAKKARRLPGASR